MDDIFRSLFFFIDGLVYWLIPQVYNVIRLLANAVIFNNTTYLEFSTRIYALIGVFMLFKVTFSLLSLFAEPEKLNDSKVGGAAIVKRIMTSLIIIALLPTIFTYAYRLQGIILEENTIGNIIFGVSSDSSKIGTESDPMGSKIELTLFKSFISSTDSTKQAEIMAVTEFSQFGNYINDDDVTYLALVSTAAGLFASAIMIMFAFNIAVRVAKLGFLQLIAPIPVLNYIDVKKGSDMLNKWVKATVTTYVDVFVRMATIFLGAYLLSLIFTNVFTLYNINEVGEYVKVSDVNMFVQVFVILGVLMFIKEAPQMIYDLLGLKMSGGGFSLNPMDKLRQTPGVGRALTGAQARVGGAVRGARTGNGWRGAWQGQKLGGKSVKGKVGWGGSKDGKGVNAFQEGQKASAKGLTGKDEPGRSLWNQTGGALGKKAKMGINEKATDLKTSLSQGDGKLSSIGASIAGGIAGATASAKVKADLTIDKSGLKGMKDQLQRQVAELGGMKQTLNADWKNNDDNLRKGVISAEQHAVTKATLTDQYYAIDKQEKAITKAAGEVDTRIETIKNTFEVNAPKNKEPYDLEKEMQKISDGISKITSVNAASSKGNAASINSSSDTSSNNNNQNNGGNNNQSSTIQTADASQQDLINKMGNKLDELNDNITKGLEKNAKATSEMTEAMSNNNRRMSDAELNMRKNLTSQERIARGIEAMNKKESSEDNK